MPMAAASILEHSEASKSASQSQHGAQQKLAALASSQQCPQAALVEQCSLVAIGDAVKAVQHVSKVGILDAQGGRGSDGGEAFGAALGH